MGEWINVSSKILIYDWPTLLIALFTALAAYGAWRSAKATKRTAEAQLFVRLYEEYTGTEMYVALGRLGAIHKQTRAMDDDARERHFQSLIQDSRRHEKDKELVRRVKYYFQKAIRLKDSGFLSEELLKKLCDVDGIELLFEVVVPYMTADNPQFDTSEFDGIKKYYEDFKRKQ
jgi:hypothetical protein